jgi:hypothetical protein
MIEEERESLNVKIRKSLSEDLRELVVQKHPQYRRGGLTFEVESALAQYIASYRMQQQSTNNSLQAAKSNPSFKVFKLKDDIYKYLIDSGIYANVHQFLSDRQLFQAIGDIKGMDNRTIKKWTKFLMDFGCIKRSGMHQFEFV